MTSLNHAAGDVHYPDDPWSIAFSGAHLRAARAMAGVSLTGVGGYAYLCETGAVSPSLKYGRWLAQKIGVEPLALCDLGRLSDRQIAELRRMLDAGDAETD